MTHSHSSTFSSRQEAVPLTPKVSRAPDDIENATEAPSRATTGVLNDGTLDDGASENGTSGELVGHIPPAGGALRLVRTHEPDERNQLDALRILSESAPSVPIPSAGQDEPREQ